jgi:hypothetical protein
MDCYQQHSCRRRGRSRCQRSRGLGCCSSIFFCGSQRQPLRTTQGAAGAARWH